MNVFFSIRIKWKTSTKLMSEPVLSNAITILNLVTDPFT